MENPWVSDRVSQPVANALLSLVCFGTLMNPASIAVQFIYRYKALCTSTRWTKTQYIKVLGVFVVWLGAHATGVCWAASSRRADDDRRFREMPDFLERPPKFFYVDAVGRYHRFALNQSLSNVMHLR